MDSTLNYKNSAHSQSHQPSITPIWRQMYHITVEPILCWLNHSGIQLPGTKVLDSICGVYGTIWVMKINVKLYGNNVGVVLKGV